MIEIKDRAGQVVKRSKNLRGILDYSSRCTFVRVLRVIASRKPNGAGLLRVEWSNDVFVEADFACYRVLCHWINARRVFAGATVSIAE